MNEFVKFTRIFERVIEVNSFSLAAKSVSEAIESKFVKLESSSFKNFRKKSRISAARTAFKEN